MPLLVSFDDHGFEVTTSVIPSREQEFMISVVTALEHAGCDHTQSLLVAVAKLVSTLQNKNKKNFE